MTYITNTEEFGRLYKTVEPALDWKFKIDTMADVRYFDWIEFHVGGFIPYINALAKLSGDKKFYFYDLGMKEDKELMNEYYQNFAQYPMIEFSVDVDEDSYLEELSREFCIKDYFIKKNIPNGEADAYFIVSATSIYTIFPESMNWHIYGEYDIELARLVSTVGLPPDMLFPHDFYTEDEANRLMAFKENR